MCIIDANDKSLVGLCHEIVIVILHLIVIKNSFFLKMTFRKIYTIIILFVHII